MKVYAENTEFLAATVAHEIKNPLALIQANIDYIELCDEEKKFGKNYAVMKNELHRVNELLAEFTKYARSGSMECTRVYAGDVVKEVIYDFYLPQRAVQIYLEAESATASFNGNRERFKIVLSNAIKNSLEAISGVGEIVVSINEIDGWVHINICDNGSGLDNEMLEKINANICFTTKKYGSGFGLMISRQIIEEHGGTYKIRNNELQGCTVEIAIPIE